MKNIAKCVLVAALFAIFVPSLAYADPSSSQEELYYQR